jgi:hypothetical protein
VPAVTSVNLASNITHITAIHFTAMLKIHFGSFKNHISLYTMNTLISLTIQKLKVVPQQYIFCEREDEHK